MYKFYIDGILLPIPPEKLNLKIKNENKTYQLIDDSSINVLKKPGLTDIDFSILIPNTRYHFALYKNNEYKNASYFLEKLENLKLSLKPFQFIVTRSKPNGLLLFDTNMKVSLEDYPIAEEAKEGNNVKVTIKLKQYRDYATKTMKITIKQERPAAVVQVTRPVSTPPTPSNKSYTVVRGDCLWNIAKKYYGNGSQYTKIYNANKDKIKNPNLIYPGQILTIPA